MDVRLYADSYKNDALLNAIKLANSVKPTKRIDVLVRDTKISLRQKMRQKAITK